LPIGIFGWWYLVVYLRWFILCWFNSEGFPNWQI